MSRFINIELKSDLGSDSDSQLDSEKLGVKCDAELMAKLKPDSDSESDILLLKIFAHTFLLTLNMSFSSNINEVIKIIQFFNRSCKGNLVFQPVPLNQFLFVHTFTSLVASLSIRQYSFLTDSDKLVFVRIEQKVLLLVYWDQHFHCIYFSIFFFASTKMRINDFSPLRYLLSTFFIFVHLFAFLCFCLVAFLCFLCFWCFLVLFCAFWWLLTHGK